MSGSGHKHISDADLKKLGLRRVDAYVHEAAGASSEGDQQKKPKTAAQRKKEERDRLIADQLDQFNIVMSVFPDKRDTIARAAAKIEDNAIQAAIEAVIAENPKARDLVLRTRGNPEALDAATSALATPGAIERGLRASSHDVAPLIDIVLDNPQVRRILEFILKKELNAGAATAGNFLRIVETIATLSDGERVVEAALARPTAVYVGKNVLALLEGRGWIADRIISRLSVCRP